MRAITTSLSAVILPVFIVIFLSACGSSAGGSDYGGGSGGGLEAVCGNSPGGVATSGSDLTPPVTTVDTSTGSYNPDTIITYTCTDNDSECDITYLSRVKKGNVPAYDPYYEWQVSGTTSTSFTIKLCGATSSGNIYEYCFYSIDKNGNDEIPQGKVYTIN